MTEPDAQAVSPADKFRPADEFSPAADAAPPGSPLQPAPPLPPPAPPRDAVPLLITLALALWAFALTRGEGTAAGLNALLIVLAVFGGLLGVLRGRRLAARPAALGVLGLGLACAVGLVLRDGSLMTTLNALGLAAAAGLGTAFLRFPGLSRLGVGALLLAGVTSVGRGFTGFPTSLGRFPWGALRGGEVQRQRGGRVLVGLLLTVPVLLVFGGLLASADGRFGRVLSGLLSWNLDDAATALMQLGFWCFLLGGPVYAGLLARRPAPQLPPVRTPQLGLTELGMPLLSLSLLFSAYLGVQTGTFSGGGPGAGQTYAEAARRGFGELTAVAALTLLLLLAAHALLRRELRGSRGYRALGAAVLLPLALLIVSAYLKLSAYIGAYGLSEIRVLGAVFLSWVSVSLLAYAVLTWRGGLERFASFSLVSGLGLIVGLNLVNPGRLIASVNVGRIPQGNVDGRGFQQASFYHLLTLGADAAPIIVAHLNALTGLDAPPNTANFESYTPTVQQARQLLRERFASGNPDWRSWNLARARARSLVLALEP